ncbi:hypothetical protein [Sorangium cellulosum]|uniref:Uncharacterized protein n=1 Tax=Sorangium cellulosum TaxID=56 RepID=A0A150QCD7_SORCE|nr:hypothetical protein [Sorangium cellulosum]KYF65637.1 hypothetical protein BE15_19175 [Sorangium cellulosum]
MSYVGVCTALATVGSLLLLGACLETEPARVGVVSEAGGFVDPERRLAVEGDESYCSSEVLRWRYDRSSGALTIADSRLLLNCCGQRAMHVERIDSIYEITERDEPDAANPRCDAVCAFDFTVAIPEVAPGKVFVRLLRDVVDAQGSAELIWQGEIDVRKSVGQVVLERAAASSDACGGSSQ